MTTDIRNFYMTSNKIFSHGVQGYHVQNKYFDPKDQLIGGKKAPIKKIDKTVKRKTYLDDYVYLHKYVPAPGKYQQGNNYISTFSKSKSHTSRKNIKQADRKTIFDEMCEKLIRDKVPAPGQYQPDMKKRPATAKSSRKPQTKDKINYLDQIQYQGAQRPGVGQYNLRPQSAQLKVTRMKPQDWIKKHSVNDKKPKTKQPGPMSYNPVLITKKDFSKRTKGNTTWGSIDRFKLMDAKDKIGPGKYLTHQKWDKNMHLSMNNQPNIYYN